MGFNIGTAKCDDLEVFTDASPFSTIGDKFVSKDTSFEFFQVPFLGVDVPLFFGNGDNTLGTKPTSHFNLPCVP